MLEKLLLLQKRPSIYKKNMKVDWHFFNIWPAKYLINTYTMYYVQMMCAG